MIFLIPILHRAIWGNYKHGVLTGKGGVELMDKEGTILEGEFVNGKLQGNVSYHM